MTGKQLKNSILQWAIQGKLVPQDPNDEPASVLLEKIRAEKARLIKEGKIKKDKKESIIYRGEDNSYYEKFADGKVVCIDDKIPFEIPSGWEWCRLGALITYQNGYAYTSSEMNKEKLGMPVIKSGNLMSLEVVLKPHNDYIEHPTQKMLASKIVYGDMLMCLSSQSDNPEPLGKTAIYKFDYPSLLNQRVLKFRPFFDSLTLYLYNVVNSFYFHYGVSHQGGGSAQANLKVEHVLGMLIPLAPQKEQCRIVNRIDELQPYISRFSVSKDNADSLNESLPIKLRKSILQEAIQGKLVPQDSTDEPASILLQRIKDEKLRLVKDGKLKKKDVIDSTIFRGDDNKYFEKKGKEVACIDDEIPFEIPESWQWCRINIICSITNGFTPLRTEDRFWRNGDINWFTVEDIRTQGEYINYTAQKITKEATTPDRIVRPGTTLLCCTASVGQCAFTNIPTTTNQQFNALTIKDDYRSLMTDEYLFLFAKTLKDELHRLSGKTTFEFISVKKVGNILVPIPPFNEQKRIVAIVNKSLASIMSR